MKMLLTYSKLPRDIVLIIVRYLNHGWNYNKDERHDMIKKCNRLREIKNTISMIILHAPYNSIPENNNYHNSFRLLITEILSELKHFYTSGYIGHHKHVTRCFNLITYYMKRAQTCIAIAHDLDKEILKTQKLLHHLFVLKGYKKRLYDL